MNATWIAMAQTVAYIERAINSSEDKTAEAPHASAIKEATGSASTDSSPAV